MRIVVWQYIYSMIDLPYIIGMSKDPRVSEVIYIANPITQARKKLGWIEDFPGLENCKVGSNLSDEEMEVIFSEAPENSYHLFSGLNVYPHVHRAFKISLKYPVTRAVICERPMTYAYGYDWVKPLWLHKYRSRLLNRKFFEYIKYIFEIGEAASHYNMKLYSGWEVFPFSYCTKDNYEEQSDKDTPFLRVSYVGALSVRKSVMTLLKAVKWLNDRDKGGIIEVRIVGDGSERLKLESYIKKHELQNVHLLGSMKNNDIPGFLVNQDVLILPSIHDGWGAVVNEALQAGLYVICSDRCGAKELLSSSTRGTVFKMGDSLQLGMILLGVINQISQIREKRDFRRKWARERLSGEALGKYMVDCLEGLNPVAPWRNEE